MITTNDILNKVNKFSKKVIDLKSKISLISKRNSKENKLLTLIQTINDKKQTASFQHTSENSSSISENESTEIKEIPIKNLPRSFIQN